MISGIITSIVAVALMWVVGRVLQAFLASRAKGISFGPVWLGASLVFGTLYGLALIGLRLGRGWSVEEGLLRFFAGFELVNAALESVFGPASSGRDAWIALVFGKAAPFLLPVFWTILYAAYLAIVLAVAYAIGAVGEPAARPPPPQSQEPQGPESAPATAAIRPAALPTGGVIASLDDLLGTGLLGTFWHAAGYHGSAEAPEPRFIAWCGPIVKRLRRILWLVFPLALSGTLPPVAWIAAAILVEGLRRNLAVPAKDVPKDDKPGKGEAPSSARGASERPSPAELVLELGRSPEGPRLLFRRSLRTDGAPARLAETDRLASENRLLRAALDRLGLSGGLWLHQALVADRLDEGQSVLLGTAELSGRATVADVLVLREVLVRGRSVLVLSPDARRSRRRFEAFAEVARTTNWRWNLFVHDLSGGRAGLDLASRQPVVLFATVDTLHEHLMPFLSQWDLFLSGLSLIVASEIDRYAGARAANAALVLTRLRRQAKGARFLCTAPAYPAELRAFAERLVGVPLARVGPELDGAPAPVQDVLVAAVRADAEEGSAPDAVAVRALAMAEGYRAELVGYEDVLAEEDQASANDLLLRRQRALVGTGGGDARDALEDAEVLVVRAGADLLPLLPAWTRHSGKEAAFVGDAASVRELGGRRRVAEEGPRFRGFRRDPEDVAGAGRSSAEPPGPSGSTSVAPALAQGSAGAPSAASPASDPPSAAVAEHPVRGDAPPSDKIARVLALYVPDVDPVSRVLAARDDVIAQGGAHPLLRPGSAIVGAAQSPMARVAHLRCALAESDWTEKELDDAFGAAVVAHELDAMRRERRLVESPRRDVDTATGLVTTRRRLRYAIAPVPHGRLRLDAVTPDPTLVRDRATGEPLFWVDRVRAAVTAYPGMIFLHAGRRYRVCDAPDQPAADAERLAEPMGGAARSSKVRTLVVEPLHEERRAGGERRTEGRAADDRRLPVERSLGGAPFRLSHPPVAVRERVLGAKRWSPRGRLLEVALYEEPIEASWASVAAVLQLGTPATPEALHALVHLFRMALPVAVRHAAGDLDVTSAGSLPGEERPTIAFVDLHPGGAGFATAVTAEVIGRVARLALLVLRGCPASCGRDDGCPACLRTWHCHEGELGLSRSGATSALEALLGPESNVA
jgi:hypothetical protein